MLFWEVNRKKYPRAQRVWKFWERVRNHSVEQEVVFAASANHQQSSKSQIFSSLPQMAPRRGLRLQVKYMRTHSHAFVHIVHFFVEIVVDTGYWIHFSLDRLHLGFKPGLFPLSSLHCQHQWNVKQLHTISKIGQQLFFLFNLQTSYRHSCHSSEKLQKNIFEAVNCDLQFLSIETNKFLFLIFPNAVKALIL